MRRAPHPLALAVAVVAVVAALGVVALPADRVSAATTTLGTGECASQVDGLTGLASSNVPGPPGSTMCGVVITDGPGTWTVPAGVTEVYLELVAGGGGGGNSGGGGAGGVILRDRMFTATGMGTPPKPLVAVTPGQVFNVSIGAGGRGGNHIDLPTNGEDTTFGTFVAKGGGAGGNWDPVTGVGTPGQPGGSGGGGGPIATISDQANPGVVKGAAGGAATDATNPDAWGNAGGSGAGTRTNYSALGPLAEYQTYLTGGGGGGAFGSYGCSIGDVQTNDGRIEGAFVGNPGIAGVIGGEGGDAVLLGVANAVVGEAWLATHGPWAQGGGGAAAVTSGAILAGSGGGFGCTYPNRGGSSWDGAAVSWQHPAGQPHPNTGEGGGAGASTDGMTKGTNGSSGIVAIAWVAGSGGGGGGAAGSPSAPTDVNGTPKDGGVDLGWNAPTNDGGSAVSDYVVEQSTDGGSTWSPSSMCTGTATSCAVTSLSNGTGYVFRVAAKNANGAGAWSESSGTVVPGTVRPAFTG